MYIETHVLSNVNSSPMPYLDIPTVDTGNANLSAILIVLLICMFYSFSVTYKFLVFGPHRQYFLVK